MGEQLLARLGNGQGLRVLEIGTGAMGWLPIPSRWVGPTGEVVGTDVDGKMLAAASALLDEELLTNVRTVRDDVFAPTLPEASFDLVHLRFQLAPVGRPMEQVQTVHCACIDLESGHPYMQLPVQFATSLRSRLLQLVDEAELDRLMEAATAELAVPNRWGMTFTLVQAWGRIT